MKLKITKHAYERASERMGMTPYTFQLEAACAFAYGVQATECKGQLLEFIRELFATHGNTDCRIYKGYIYMFNGNKITTAFKLKDHLLKQVPACESL